MKPRVQAYLLAAAFAWLPISASTADQGYVPVVWSKFVRVNGQPEPIPLQWIDSEEARVAHDLKLPESVPKPVVFNFDKAWLRSWFPWVPEVRVQYFNHLCSTEAGEWIFRTVQNVEGLYFARPQGTPTTDMLTDPLGPEMPWIQRVFMLQSDRVQDQGTWFVQPPNYNYKFVEQPRRPVDWQAGINEPYVRLFGYTRERVPVPGVHGIAPDQQYWYSYRDRTPMQVAGTSKLDSRYGYTWRGLRRERDRELGIAGGEVLVYDVQTKEVLAVRRQFLIASKNPRGPGKAMWEVAARCAELPRSPVSLEFTQFAFDVLQTVEPSKTGK